MNRENRMRAEDRFDLPGIQWKFGWTKFSTAVSCNALAFVALFALVLLMAQPAHGQSETVLYNFTGGDDGGTPQSRLTFDSAGNLYGTTYGGGLGFGTVFEVSPNGNWSEKVLYSFSGGIDGGNPLDSHVIFDSLGNLYGTASSGGVYGCGVVFELSPGAAWTETVLYSFSNNGTDGCNPVNGMIMDGAGNLYGKTFAGGGNGGGVAFELSPSGGGTWTEQVLEGGLGAGSYSGVFMDSSGNIYGAYGGAKGIVFEMSPNGSGGWTYDWVYQFGNGRGRDPDGTPVVDSSANVYGTTDDGGTAKRGTVYRLIAGPSGLEETQICVFKGFTRHASDGRNPVGGVVFDAAGNMYGTTVGGGYYGGGSVYELKLNPRSGKYAEKILWSFDGADGQNPYGSLIRDSAGNLYGTGAAGGTGGAGVVFEVTP